MAGCTGGPAPQPHASEPPSLLGGVYRTEIEDFGFTGAFDPVGEYSQVAFALYSQLLLRTLVTYRHVAGVSGMTVVPDLATTTGEVSADGLSWTFMLKQGVKWGPPVNRSITSADVAYAFRRMETAALQAQYGYWFDGLIVGMSGPSKVMPSGISGIDTPNDHTIVFHLRHPAGDFAERLALPAAAPVPMEVAGCFSKAGDYGRDLVSSGAYMVQGADQVDLSSCAAVRPESGFDPTRRLTLVRNPNYDAATDARSDRSNYLDGVDIRIQTNPVTIRQDLSAGRIDGLLSPVNDLQQVRATPPPGGVRVREFVGSGLVYLFMNLLVPPFDDVHVRRAVALAIDRTKVLASAGPTLVGAAATHLFRQPATGKGAPDDPYPFDLAAAKAEMAKSRYDHNHDGRCDDLACRTLFNSYLPRASSENMVQALIEGMAAIGIRAGLREIYLNQDPARDPRNMIPVGFGRAWTPDLPDPIDLARTLTSATISCRGQANYSEVGMTRQQMLDCHLPTTLPLPPSVDADVATCEALSGDARATCWDTFDRHVMEDIVPWVPIAWRDQLTVTGPTVVATTVTLDQFTGLISLCHLAVHNHSAPPS